MVQKFNLGLLIFLWVLIGCKWEDEVSMQPSIESNDNRTSVLPVEKQTYQNPQYSHLLEFIEGVRDYLQEEEEMLLMEIKQSNIDPPSDMPYQKSVKALHVIQEHIEALLTGKETANDFLYFLLKSRFMHLKERKESIETYLDPYYTGKKMIAPTNQSCFDFLVAHQEFQHTRGNVERYRAYATIEFEWLNLLIREVFQRCNLDDLKKETIQLLRASVQLHPVLTGERPELGHPDEAGGAYAILGSILDPQSRENMPKLHRIYNRVIQAVDFEKEGHWGLLKTLYQMINYEKGIVGNSLDDRLNKDLMSIERNLDLAIYEAHFIPQSANKENQPLTIPVQQITRNNFSSSTYTRLQKKLQAKAAQLNQNKQGTKYELGLWPDALPDPPFLRKKPVNISLEQSISKKKKKSKNKEKQPLNSYPAISKQETVEGLAGLVESQQDARQNINDKKGTIEKAISTVKVSEEAPTMESSVAVEPAVELPLVKEDKQEVTTTTKTKPMLILSNKQPGKKVPVKKIRKKDTYTSHSQLAFDTGYLPSGLRRFHSKMLTSPSLPRRLRDNDKQKIVDELFDGRRSCKVTFGRFESVWNYIGGKICNNHGGSHRGLISPQGEKLFGIFAHGKNQVYGKKYIQYLRALAWCVGLRSSEWLCANQAIYSK